MSRLFRFELAMLLAALLGSTVSAADKEEIPMPPPAEAIVLFDGKDLNSWKSRNGGPAPWKVENGYMEVAPGKGDLVTKDEYGPDFQLHVEFWLPLLPSEKGQARANSGVYLLGRYEIQVLDSYMNETYPKGACGALYEIHAPKTNASKPPEQWQTYDITFEAPRVDEAGKVTKKGRVTVIHNGVKIIDNGEFDKTTRGGLDEKITSQGPILLQDHRNKTSTANVRFRNIWLKPLKQAPKSGG